MILTKSDNDPVFVTLNYPYGRLQRTTWYRVIETGYDYLLLANGYYVPEIVVDQCTDWSALNVLRRATRTNHSKRVA